MEYIALGRCIRSLGRRVEGIKFIVARSKNAARVGVMATVLIEFHNVSSASWSINFLGNYLGAYFSYRCGLSDGLSGCAAEVKEFIGSICRSVISSTMHMLKSGSLARSAAPLWVPN